MYNKHRINVLLVPLDWGLGHSSRCIPIIRYLLASGCNVIIGGEGSSESLLRLEFPHLQFVALKGYHIHYTNGKRFLPLKILCQLPKIWSRVKHEHAWLKTKVKELSIDLVISDNRFGLWHSNIQSIYITHQLQIKGPYKWLETLMRTLNYRYINNFDACWVPDVGDDSGLAGKLSHPKHMPDIPVKYLGILSRFERSEPAPIKYKLLIILSGPEPQRSIFERLLLTELANYNEPVLLVRGLPGETAKLVSFNKVVIENHQTAANLQHSFIQSEFVIARAGYTTIMDLVQLGKKAVLVPTPGQTEQEYLAHYLHNKNYFATISQTNFKLPAAIELLNSSSMHQPIVSANQFKKVVDECLQNLVQN